MGKTAVGIPTESSRFESALADRRIVVDNEDRLLHSLSPLPVSLMPVSEP